MFINTHDPVRSCIERLREDMTELHEVLKDHHSVFYPKLNEIDRKIDGFRHYYDDQKRKGLTLEKPPEPLEHDRIANYLLKTVPENRLGDVMDALLATYPPRGTF